jgi:phage shock protein PspC (stress-responsive transcriptional regulator)
VLGGVAAGFGRYLDVDPVLVRLAFVILAFADGLGILVYLVAWALVPREAAAASAAGGFPTEPEGQGEDAGTAGDAGGARLAIGYGLIAVGTVFLMHNLDWIRWPSWARFEVLWPLVLVGMGVALVLRSAHKGAPHHS